MQNRPLVGRHNLRLAIALVLAAALGAAYALQERQAWAQAQEAPQFEVDAFWPKALPNHWVLGQAIGVWVDDQDVVWIVHRGSATLADNEKGLELKNAECCAAAPPILAFDASGKVVRSWGGPGQGYDWPTGNHGIFVDHENNVWIGGNGPGDSHVVKFTKDGKFLMQAGKPDARRGPANAQGQPTYVGNSHDQVSFGRIAKIFVDPRTNEAFLADGYLNKRVAVIDGASGKLKRYWGAYGEKPNDANLGPYVPNAPPMRQFLNPVHCVMLSKDGLLYVCDRNGDRIQVFKPDGAFVKEAFIARGTKASGSAWDVAFSHDPQQRFLYVTDGMNNRVHILRRDTLEELTTFGDGGRQPGQFYGVHSIAVDSKGNIYTTETWEGKRLQKFVFKGIGRVPAPHQGTLWPQSARR
jgi:DNA-binding beta-propeller fold protein YncE